MEETLYDHYKESVELIREQIKARDRAFFFLLAAIGLSLLQLGAPAETTEAIRSFLTAKTGASLALNLSVIKSAILVIVLAVDVRYLQATIYVERQYSYVHSIEKELCSTGIKITREGDAYLSDYPFLLNVIHVVYTIVFPAIIIFTMVLRGIDAYADYMRLHNVLLLAFDAIMICSVAFLTVCYVAWMYCHLKKEYRMTEKSSNAGQTPRK